MPAKVKPGGVSYQAGKDRDRNADGKTELAGGGKRASGQEPGQCRQRQADLLYQHCHENER